MSRIFYALTKIVLSIYYRVYHRLGVTGLSNLPTTRPVILAANHTSYLDPPLVGVAFPDPTRFVAGDWLFRIPVIGFLIKHLGAVPVSQENKGSAAGVLRMVLNFLDTQQNVVIFPEGVRSEDGNLMHLEGGTALLAFKSGVPVVPVRIDGAFESLPVTGSFPKPLKIRVDFRKPLSASDMPESLSEKERRAMFLDMLRTRLLPNGEEEQKDEK